MDRVTEQLTKEFAKENSLEYSESLKSEVFEKFCGYSIVSNEFGGSFDIEDVHIGGGEDEGVDCIAIVVNGEIVTPDTELQGLFKENSSLEVKLIFVQTETSSSFSVKKLTNFVYGVKKFLEQGLTRDDFESDAIYDIYKIIDSIYGNVTSLKKNPDAIICYVTTSSNGEDRKLNERKKSLERELIQTNLFTNVSVRLIGASDIQKLYRNSRGKTVKQLTLSRKATLPAIPGVEQAYVGIASAPDFINLISDDNGNIDKSLFYDNIRDYQGQNDVNKEMSATLGSDEQSKRFALMNNGVTIVAKKVQSTGDTFVLHDFQIVNGCQTSHVLYENRGILNDSIVVTVKIISTENDGVTNDIIRSTNRQTQVREEELMALSETQKRIEDYYNSYNLEDDLRLFYERRMKQYAASPGVEKIRVVSVSSQIKTFASVFLRRPHSSTSFYGELKTMVGNRIFSSSHKPVLYYTSSLINFRFDYMIRSKIIDSKYRRYRHFILMSFFYLASGKKYYPESKFNSSAIEKDCARVIDILSSQAKYTQLFNECTSYIDSIADFGNREQVKLASFTESLERELGIRPKSSTNNSAT